MIRRLLTALMALSLLPVAATAQDTTGQIDEPIYAETLPADPLAITRAYLVDYAAWNAFAYADHEQTGDSARAWTAYRRLIDLYCGPAKHHLDIAFGTQNFLHPKDTQVTGSREEDTRTIVAVRYTQPSETGSVANYEFVFRQDESRWLLDEIYYYDDYGGEWLPSL